MEDGFDFLGGIEEVAFFISLLSLFLTIATGTTLFFSVSFWGAIIATIFSFLAAIVDLFDDGETISVVLLFVSVGILIGSYFLVNHYSSNLSIGYYNFDFRGIVVLSLIISYSVEKIISTPISTIYGLIDY